MSVAIPIRLHDVAVPKTCNGVLVDIARKVKNNEPVDLTMGYFNVIWQGDANDAVLRSLEHAASPAWIMNITGEETLSVRQVAVKFGEEFNVEPRFTGSEADTALLSNPGKAFALFGKPPVPVGQLIRWTAHWIREDHKLLDKPTHFEVRDGKY